MVDYIDREAAIEKLRVAYFDSEIQSAANDPCIVDAMTGWAIRQTKSVPAADVKPVVHAHWINKKYDTAHDTVGDVYVCPICGEFLGWQPPFCPNCGADMRGTDNE